MLDESGFETKHNENEKIYNKKKEQAFLMSKTNRRETDKLEKEANDILIQIESLESEKK